MKIPHLSRLSHYALFFSIVLIAGLSPIFAQTTYYFDTNGATNWFGFTVGGEYTWDTSELWSTSNTGNVATSSWTNGNIAAFRLYDDTGKVFIQGQTITVNLAQNVTVAGLSNTQNGLTVLQADETRTITLSPGGTIYANGGVVTSAGMVIGNNVNLSGDLIITSGSNGALRINGTGDTYEGTITINGTGNGGLWLESGTRVSQDVDIILNSGALRVQNSTIGSLSGDGGYITAGGQTSITIDQSKNTTWGGQVTPASTAGFISIFKQGSGRLEMTKTDAIHYSSSANWNIEEGSLYVGGQLVNVNASDSNPVGRVNHNVVVSSGATFGGTVDTSRRVVLNAADSILDPGYYGNVGTLNLSAGIMATNGGTFHFDLNGETASRINLGNVLTLDGTIRQQFLTLNGTKTINLYNIGDLGDIVEHTPYVLMDATASGATWDMTGWEFHLAGDDWGAWATDTENVVWNLTGDKLTVTFVPEPSTWLLLVSSACGLFVLGMRRRD